VCYTWDAVIIPDIEAWPSLFQRIERQISIKKPLTRHTRKVYAQFSIIHHPQSRRSGCQSQNNGNISQG
jgi:hypothetical protein